MTDARYDKVNPDVGLFRAPLAADIVGGAVSSTGGYGPVAVSLNASGQIVIGTGGQSGFVGVMVKNFPLYPRMGNIPGQPNIAVPIGGKAGNVVDVMTAGEMTNGAGWVAGTAYYAALDGTLTTNPADGPLVGWTVGSDRMVVRTDVGGQAGGGFLGFTASTTALPTTTETALATINLDANEVQAGAVYEFHLSGVCTLDGTHTEQFNIRLGGIAGTSLAASTASAFSAVTAVPFEFDGMVNFHSATKAVATGRIMIQGATGSPVVFGSAAEVTVATTTAQALVFDGLANGAGNTITVLGGYAKRVA